MKIPTSGYGAIEKIVLERSKAFRRNGFKVQLVANCDNTNVADEVVNVAKIFKSPKSMLGVQNWIVTLKWFKYISEYISRKNIIWDSPIISDALLVDPLDSYLLASSFGLERFVYIMHGNHYSVHFPGKFIFPYTEFLFPSFRKIMYGSLNTKLYHIMKVKGYTTFYLPNGIEPLPLSSICKTPGNYACFVGAIRMDKGAHLAIKYARKVGINLKIVGPIKDHKYFVKLIKPYLSDSIVYLGEIKRDLLNEVMKQALVLLYCSSFDDPQATVLLESLSYGVPVLALDFPKISGLYDIVEDGINGYIGNMDYLVQHFCHAISLDRFTIARNTGRYWSWDYVLKRNYLGVIEKMSPISAK